MRILLCGGNGGLGLEIARKLLGKEHDFDIKLLLTVRTQVAWNSLYMRLSEEGLLSPVSDIHVMDITDENAVRTVCTAFCPDVILNCTAYTAVDLAETDPMAEKVNVTGTMFLSKAAEEMGAKLVYVSTDYVFDGTKNAPYTEEDRPNPLNAYGRTKEQGERMVKEYCTKHFIIRTAWLYGAGKNFVKTMLGLAKTKKELSVVSDRTGSPTSAAELADLILFLMQTEKYGIWHGACEGSASWYDFAVEIMRLTGKDVKVLPISTEEYPTAAKRPHYSVLSNERLQKETAYRMKEWKAALKEYLE